MTTFRFRIESVDYGAPGLININGVMDNAEDYVSYVAGAPPTNEPQIIAYIGPTRLYLLDVPLLRDADNNAGFYIAASGYYPGWKSAMVYRSVDGGSTYSEVGVISREATVGAALTALADGPTTVWDEGNTVDVAVFNKKEIYSASEINVLNGANAAILGNEIIQWKTATLLSAGKYRLSGLARGRKGSDWATSGHKAGDRFVCLSATTLRRYNFGAGDIGSERLYKAVTHGMVITGTRAVRFTNTGVGLKPYAPVHISGSRDDSGSLTISWIRRTRVDGEWRDYVDVPLGESSEAYEVDIMDGSTVVRTIDSLSSAAATYSAADQTTDFGSPQASVHVHIYQLSATVGRGYAGEATI